MLTAKASGSKAVIGAGFKLENLCSKFWSTDVVLADAKFGGNQIWSDLSEKVQETIAPVYCISDHPKFCLKEISKQENFVSIYPASAVPVNIIGFLFDFYY